MADNIVSVWNLALSLLGESRLITSEDDTSKAARQCDLWYPEVRDNVLAAAPWPSAKKSKRLALLVERDTGEDWVSTDPSPRYIYAYSQPSDMIRPRHLANYTRFELGWLDTVGTIETNSEDAVLTYTFLQNDPTKWGTDLTEAIVSALAAKLSFVMNLKLGLKDRMDQIAMLKIAEARAALGNQQESEMQALASWTAARGYTPPLANQAYLYPFDQYGAFDAI